MARRQFDALRLDLADGERVHVFGRPELFEARGTFRLRALTIERFGLGAHLAALERLKKRLAAEGLFDSARKRRLLLPRRIGLVTGNDAAAKRDVLAGITARFPPARILVAETYVQGPRAAFAMTDALQRLSREPGVDVMVLARGGGSFDDLLAFSDERLVRAVASCPVPVVSAVGHEQDTPPRPRRRPARLDADGRGAARRPRPRGAPRRPRAQARRSGAVHARRILDRERTRISRTHDRLRSAPALLVERRRARLEQTGRDSWRSRRARPSNAATRLCEPATASSARPVRSTR